MLQPFPPTTSHRLTVKKKKRKKNKTKHGLFSMFPSSFAFLWVSGTIRVEVPSKHGKVTVSLGMDVAFRAQAGYMMDGVPRRSARVWCSESRPGSHLLLDSRHCSVISKELIELRIGLI